MTLDEALECEDQHALHGGRPDSAFYAMHVLAIEVRRLQEVAGHWEDVASIYEQHYQKLVAAFEELADCLDSYCTADRYSPRTEAVVLEIVGTIRRILKSGQP